MTLRRCLLATLALVLSFSVASFLYAQAFGVPTSDIFFEGRLSLPDGQLVRYQAREGVLMTVRNEKNGYWFGLASKRSSDKSRQVDVALFSISGRPDEPKLVQVGAGTFSVELQRSRVLPLAGKQVAIYVDDINEGLFKKAAAVDVSGLTPWDLKEMYGPAGGELCEISCGSLEVSANAVAMKCGACEGDGVKLAR
jgi:hypothetical protein